MKLRKRIAMWLWPELRIAPEDTAQITYTLERQIQALDAHAMRLLNQRDYSAEFPFEEAENLRRALVHFKEIKNETHRPAKTRVVVGPDTSTH